MNISSEGYARKYKYNHTDELSPNFSRSGKNGRVPSKTKNSNRNFVGDYLTIRIRQLYVSLILFGQLIEIVFTELKIRLIQRMYWGRSSFYKQFFHTVVVVITLFAIYTELGVRIVTPQREEISIVSLSTSRPRIDSDVFQQQGSLFPLNEFNDEADGVYREYTVAQGDSISKIASENGISENTIRWANNIPINQNSLSVGQIIRIPQMNGVLYTVREGDTVDSILRRVQLKDPGADRLTFLDLNSDVIRDGSPVTGTVVFLPDATIPLPRPTPTRRPAATTISGGGAVVNVAPGTFTNPMQLCNYQYSRGYSGFHRGVDWAVAPGCNVVAAGSGVVKRAGWCSGLGYCVLISHAGGLSTIYGHGNGVLYVRVGDEVSAGQRIMQSGNTGISSGPHLHLSLGSNGRDIYGCISCRINPRGIIPGA